MAGVGFISLSRSANPKALSSPCPSPPQTTRISTILSQKERWQWQRQRQRQRWESHRRSFRLVPPVGTYTLLDILFTGDNLDSGFVCWMVNPALLTSSPVLHETIPGLMHVCPLKHGEIKIITIPPFQPTTSLPTLIQHPHSVVDKNLYFHTRSEHSP